MKKFLKSFIYAGKGIYYVFKTELNFKIMVGLFVAAIILGLSLKISRLEFIVIIIISGITLAFEILNSSLEKFLDLIHPENHLKIKIIKDSVAGAVLILSFFSFLVALIIFTS